MTPNYELGRKLLKDPRYPRTAKYDPKWMIDLDLGCPTLWLLEGLCEEMTLTPGMRVLDLGCGKAAGSIFLAKEFGVQVWAADLWIPPTENWQRIREAGVEDLVFPIRAEAHELPFASEFFDALIAVNSLQFFATEEMYLSWHLARLVKPGGQFGVVLPGFYQEVAGNYPANVPDQLKKYWDKDMLNAWHSAEWWRDHWLKTNKVDVLLADNYPDNEGYQTYLRWEQIIEYEDKLAEDDAGRTITFVRLVARKKT